ncbi:MAG: SusC/RagA family TonB-linked outer membrane protein, partial [Segetibacter sp.]|nr:SusC/RagA family TonB-linked outer membrane protein [Segetibacter sp.]
MKDEENNCRIIRAFLKFERIEKVELRLPTTNTCHMSFKKRSITGLLSLSVIIVSSSICKSQTISSSVQSISGQSSKFQQNKKVSREAGMQLEIKGEEKIDQITAVFEEVRQEPVRGRVMSKDNTPLAGATITVKGKNRSVVSDANGNFQIAAVSGDILLVEYVNYEAQEIRVTGQSVGAVSLIQKETNIGEVVVTALGITRQSRSIGYSATNVKADELTVNRTPNLMNALQGKVAGVNISGLGTGPAGTSKIRIRGQSSISGQNNPLIVINGIPVDNTNFGTNPGNVGSDNSIGVRGGGNTSDGGDGLSSI